MRTVTKGNGGEMMVRTDLLTGIIASRGIQKDDVAAAIKKTPATFRNKMKSGNFTCDEATILVDLLEIDDPAGIFLCHGVATRND